MGLYGSSKISTGLSDIKYRTNIETCSSIDKEDKSLDFYQGDTGRSKHTYTIYWVV